MWDMNPVGHLTAGHDSHARPDCGVQTLQGLGKNRVRDPAMRGPVAGCGAGTSHVRGPLRSKNYMRNAAAAANLVRDPAAGREPRARLGYGALTSGLFGDVGGRRFQDPQAETSSSLPLSS